MASHEVLKEDSSVTKDLDFQPQVEAVNVAVSGLSQIHLWALRWTKKDLSDYHAFRFERQFVGEILEKAHDMLWNIHTGKPFQYDEAQTAIDMLAAPKDKQKSDQIDIFQPVNIQNEEDLHLTVNKIRGALHDAAGLYGAISSAMADVYEENIPEGRKDALRGLKKLAKETAMFADTLQDQYPKDVLFAIRVMTDMKHEIFFILGTEIEINADRDWGDNDTQVAWSSAWLETVAGNIAQNLKRVQAKQLIIWAEMTPDNAAVDFVFDDNGPGFPEDIVTNGFQSGKSHWADPNVKGEGVGMAYHAKILREHYGGDLIPEHRTDAQGNRIPGARLRVRLPFARAQEKT